MQVAIIVRNINNQSAKYGRETAGGSHVHRRLTDMFHYLKEMVKYFVKRVGCRLKERRNRFRRQPGLWHRRCELPLMFWGVAHLSGHLNKSEACFNTVWFVSGSADQPSAGRELF
jgi:hypothetical protein